LKALRELARRNICPTRTAFAHARNSDLREFERFYLCPVEFGRAANEGALSDLLEFSNDALSIPLLSTDAKLLEALQPFCDMAAKERATVKGTSTAGRKQAQGGTRKQKIGTRCQAACRPPS
jgi:hypothetical protein